MFLLWACTAHKKSKIDYQHILGLQKDKLRNKQRGVLFFLKQKTKKKREKNNTKNKRVENQEV